MDKYETTTKYIPIKVYARIKGNAILTIVDTGAYMSMITKFLAQALGLKWILSSRKDVVSIDGKPQPALEEVENLQIVIADAVTYIKAHVVNSAVKSVLLGTDWIIKYQADILGSSRKLRFKVQGRIIEVDVVASKDQQVKDNLVFALWESELEALDITEWVYVKEQEYVNPTLTLALIGRIESTSKQPKILKPIQKLLKEYDDIIFKGSYNLE